MNELLRLKLKRLRQCNRFILNDVLHSVPRIVTLIAVQIPARTCLRKPQSQALAHAGFAQLKLYLSPHPLFFFIYMVEELREPNMQTKFWYQYF